MTPPRKTKPGDARRASVSPKGHATLVLEDGTELKIRMDFNAAADADEYLGRSIVQGIMADPLNFHLFRTAIYFGSRKMNGDLKIRGVAAAGELLSGVDVEKIADAVTQSFIAGGLMTEEDAQWADDSEDASDDSGSGEE